jgi:pimeloyl-ACP methyl ester carboxylesterase/tetratricopeptide (TPR) repeat protein
MRAQTVRPTRGEKAFINDEVEVPAQLGWPGLESVASTRGATRGFLGKVLLKAVEVITGLVIKEAADATSKRIISRIDGRVDAGVYKLSSDKLEPLKGKSRITKETGPKTEDGPILVLLHGTFVDTVSTFGQLWQKHPRRVRQLFEYYGGRVYALDHPTLGDSPIKNAITLVTAMPKGAKLHLVTHSRGGVVAEVLARVCGGQGLRKAERTLFSESKYSEQLAELEELEALVKDHVTVERIVRVACPVRGTLLASKRLDAYLSVLKWGLELAGLPVVPEFVEFVKEVAAHRADPTEMPGVEAMMPDSAIVRWLNGAAEPIPTQLRAVAGDMQGDSVISWLKTLLSDAFYWTDNDLVVQTRSMYGGTPRAFEGATFVLDRGSNVSHFNYFANERTVALITKGLIEERPEEFQLIGPLSWAGKDASGVRAARAIARGRTTRDTAERPAVFVLPGILGSNLSLNGERLWLSARFFNRLDELAWNPSTDQKVCDDGPIGIVYDDLIEHLAETHEVIRFGFDWRRPIEDEARRLADAVDAQLTLRNATQQPVRLVAHSMGGLVVRAMELERRAVWERMMARGGARILMLGTPNGGSWSPMQVLSGDDTLGNALATLGTLFDSHRARQTMANMPGFLQLQAALLDPTLKLDQQSRWRELAEEDLQRLREQSLWHALVCQLSAYQWGVPSQVVLDQASALRRRFDEQLERLSLYASKILLVVGRSRYTPATFQMTQGGLEYLDVTNAGDGRVTLRNALLPGVSTYQVNVSHSDLPRHHEAFRAYIELLTEGTTRRLDRVSESQGIVRGANLGEQSRLVRNRASRGLEPIDPPSVEADVFGFGGRANESLPTTATPVMALPITVVNGSLKYLRHPLMLGHYVSTRLTGTESTVDRLIGGTMGEALKVGAYPQQTGTQKVFLNTRRDPNQPLSEPRPASVIVVGLGEEGNLTMAELRRTVCQGVVAYSQRECEKGAGGATSFELAATLMGSGGTGVYAGTAAQAIAKGVYDANVLLAQIQWPIVTHLYLIELYLDRASEAHYALLPLRDAHAQKYALTSEIETITGALPRPCDAGYRGASYDFVTAVQRVCSGEPVIEYILDSGRARNEVRAQTTQAKLVDELVRVGADSDNTDAKIGRSLFQLLVPTELESFLSSANAVVLQLDKDTARYPWEMLESSESHSSLGGEQLPWAVRAKLLRKLRTTTFREHPVDVGKTGAVLVIGEPETDPKDYAELPNAREEAEIVGQVLKTAPILNPNALATINALLEKRYRVIHIAGHGKYDENGAGGVVLSNGTVLGPREIKAMRTVPELVFVNCCYLGIVRPDTKQKRNALGEARVRFAAGVAEQLIENGVRCVVAAGWAVEDEPAKVFATRFYERLLRGDRFIDAVGEAREAAWRANPRGNTWAAYQCYGDPDWRYVIDDRETGTTTELLVPSSEALTLALKTAETEALYQDNSDESKQSLLERLRQMEARYGQCWGKNGAVAEAFARAFSANGAIDAAIHWYERAIAASDGGASMRAAEQLGNLYSRRGEKKKDLANAREEIYKAIKLLEKVASFNQADPDTDSLSMVERECLLGSAFKRLTLVEHRHGNPTEAMHALSEMLEHYGRAETIARKIGADNLFYPALNCLAAELRRGALKDPTNFPKFDKARIEIIRESLTRASNSQLDFWSLAGLIELDMFVALATGNWADALPRVLEAHRQLRERVSAPFLWDSVAAQARFTLEPYLTLAKSTEANVARELLETLKGYASLPS